MELRVVQEEIEKVCQYGHLSRLEDVNVNPSREGEDLLARTAASRAVGGISLRRDERKGKGMIPWRMASCPRVRHCTEFILAFLDPFNGIGLAGQQEGV